MTSKMKLLASVAIAAVSLVGAQGASAGNYYVNVSGGANWLHHDGFDATKAPTTSFTFHNEAQVGFLLSAAVGQTLSGVLPGLRVEGEFAYRENDMRGTGSSTTDLHLGPGGALDYQHSTYSLMANAWYDLSVMGFNPYVGGGIGWAHSNLDGNIDGVSFADDEGGFAWQLGAGLTFDVLPNTKMNIGYRYFQGPDVTVHAPFSGNPLTGDISSKNDSVTVGFTFGL